MNRGSNFRRRNGVRRCCGFSMTVALALAVFCVPSLAQDTKPDTTSNNVKTDPATGDRWVFTVAPYAWAVGIVGDVGVGSRKAHVNASFRDILEDSDSLIGLQG